MEIEAVLSTTVLPLDGAYLVETLMVSTEDLVKMLEGVPHYIGHPSTQAVVESLGATQAKDKLFAGLQVGQTALAFPLIHNPRRGWVTTEQEVDLPGLRIRKITRVPWGGSPVGREVKK